MVAATRRTTTIENSGSGNSSSSVVTVRLAGDILILCESFKHILELATSFGKLGCLILEWQAAEHEGLNDDKMQTDLCVGLKCRVPH